MNKQLILERIDELMQERRITRYELKENCEISSTIYQWKKNAQRDRQYLPSLKSIEKICKFFNVSLSYFFAFDIEERRRIKEAELAISFEGLNDEQIEILRNIILQFKKYA